MTKNLSNISNKIKSRNSQHINFFQSLLIKLGGLDNVVAAVNDKFSQVESKLKGSNGVAEEKLHKDGLVDSAKRCVPNLSRFHFTSP